MKAIVRDTYGPPDVLKLREIDKPQISDEEHLRRADRRGVRGARKRRVQHPEGGDGPIHRCGSCHRLHPRGLRRGRTTLRCDRGHRRELLVGTPQARPRSPGTLVVVGGEGGGRWLGGTDRQLRAMMLSPLVGQKLGTFVNKENHEDLLVLKELTESGKITPVIDRTY